MLSMHQLTAIDLQKIAKELYRSERCTETVAVLVTVKDDKGNVNQTIIPCCKEIKL